MANRNLRPSPREITRRALLGTAGALGLTSIPGMPSFADDDSVRDGASAATFGPASTSLTTLCSLVYQGHMYVVTRNVIPAKLIEISLSTKLVTRVVDLPPSGQTTGDGAWAITQSGGKIYVGMYPDARVHCFDPATGNVHTVGQCGSTNTYVWNLAAAGDGMLFAGTGNDGGLWQIDPSTDTITKLGSPLAGAMYGRFVAAQGDRWVYFGVYLPITLMRYDRVTGTFADITPAELTNQVYGPFVTTDQFLYAVGNGRLVRMNLDGTDPVYAPAPSGDGIGQLAVSSAGAVFGGGNKKGALYQWTPGTPLRRVALSPENTRCVGIHIAGDTVVGGYAWGGMFLHNIGTGEHLVIDLLNAGYEGAPEHPQTIASDATNPDLVYIGGNAGIQVHTASTRTSFRVRVPGELKVINVIDGKVFSVLYPSGQIVQIMPDTRTYESLGVLGSGQTRPHEARFHPATRNLAIASGPSTGSLVGALTLFNVHTHQVHRYPNILRDEAVMSVWVDGNVAYIAGDIRGGESVEPTRESASVAAFDLINRRLLWTLDPLPDAVAIQSVAVCKNVLYGVCRVPTGRWFAMDLPTRQVIRSGSLPAHGKFEESVGQLYLAIGGQGQIYRMAPGAKPTLLWTNIGNSWFTKPQIAPVTDTNRKYWGLYQTNLAQYDLGH